MTPADSVRNWVNSLLGRVRDLGDGIAFEDAQGAMWLPGDATGHGPLRRRAELASLRSARSAGAAAREAAADAASRAHAALADAESRAAGAEEAAANADQQARRAREHDAECTRQLERVRRDIAQAEELWAQLAARGEAMEARVATLAEQRTASEARLAEARTGAVEARTALAEAERRYEGARDARTAAQVDLAQAEARSQVAVDRDTRLADEYATATDRLEALRTELRSLSTADGELAQQMANWRVDLAARHAALADAEARLADAEAAVRDADTRLMAADQALDTARHEGAALAEELHRLELRRSDIAGRQHATRERLEAEWRRPWETLVASCTLLDTDSDVAPRRGDGAAGRDHGARPRQRAGDRRARRRGQAPRVPDDATRRPGRRQGVAAAGDPRDRLDGAGAVPRHVRAQSARISGGSS